MKWLLSACLLAQWFSVFSQVTRIPVTLYRSTYDAVGPGKIEYFAVTPCAESCASNQWALLSIAVPDNPTWDKTQPLVIVELSRCKDKFDVNCVFATNYIWGKQFSPQIEWEWNKKENLDSTGTFYMRATGPIATLTYSFEIQFQTAGSIQSGTYNADAFRSTVPANTVYNRLKQMAKLQESSEISNFQTDVLFIKFCVADFPTNCDKNNFRVVASAMSTAERPMSQFNLYACMADTIGDSCGTYMYDVADKSTIGVVQLDITSNIAFNATNGIYYAIYGLGGEPDKINEYIFNVRLYNQ